ncbi:MAG: DUF3991 domain-containing protein [Acidobacteriota bacterium]
MTSHQRRDEADRLRGVPLEAVLTVMGARPEPADKAKWHTARGVLSVTGPKFMNWSQEFGGGGAIDLVMHLLELDFKGAIGWLQRHFPDPVSPSASSLRGPKDLQLPPSDPAKVEMVRRYLLGERALPADLLQLLFDCARLYADHRANAVFVLLGSDHTPVGAELRGTAGTSWRGLAPGSRKDLGYFSIPVPETTTVVLCESAIDAVSCLALHPGCLCLSASGASPNPAWLPSLIRPGYEIYCGFDTDPTGEKMPQGHDRPLSSRQAPAPAPTRLE